VKEFPLLLNKEAFHIHSFDIKLCCDYISNYSQHFAPHIYRIYYSVHTVQKRLI